MQPVHLFVLEGDLTKLSCDGYVLPSDGDPGVGQYWAPLLPDLEENGHWLNIMLDRMATRAAKFSATSAAYLLDDRYRVAGVNNTKLIDRLGGVANLVERNAEDRSAAWGQVGKALIAFGLDEG